MNSIVHLSIANQTYQKTKKKTKSSLLLPIFLIGSIWPDIDHRLSKLPHEMNASLPLIKDIIKNVSSPFHSNTLMERISRSFLMGIICHFISDYFCYAHTPQFTDNIYRHHLYEFKMIGYIRRSKYHAINKSEFIMTHSEDFEALLVREQDRYQSDQVDYLTDLAYAKKCAVILFEYLIQIPILTKYRRNLPCKNYR